MTWQIFSMDRSYQPVLFVYLFPDLEGLVLLLGTIISVWQGILLWKQDTRQYTNAG